MDKPADDTRYDQLCADVDRLKAEVALLRQELSYLRPVPSLWPIQPFVIPQVTCAGASSEK